MLENTVRICLRSKAWHRICLIAGWRELRRYVLETSSARQIIAVPRLSQICIFLIALRFMCN